MGTSWIDISVPVASGRAVWPGDPGVEVSRRLSMDRGDEYNISSVAMNSHTGTHMDSPLHFLAGAVRDLRLAGVAASALRMAAGRLEEEGALPGGSTIAAVPDYLAAELKGLELRFWEAIPEADRVILETDRPGEPAGGEIANLSMMSFAADPARTRSPGPGRFSRKTGLMPGMPGPRRRWPSLLPPPTYGSGPSLQAQACPRCLSRACSMPTTKPP